ncbi:hypothetical protein HAX54_020716 [Datura stramonium]|uniref:START domain-containing protein n=1 Tax=Datura stramonium TaxID=4076 RepID=A0ABS8URL5_DATST|nr:hypothetical protein [Datura stramonium]
MAAMEELLEMAQMESMGKFISNIVWTALAMDVQSNGIAENLNGAMTMRTADGIWAIVDVSLDHILTTRCWKRPSGCLIKAMPNGYSKVTWIKHVEVDGTSIHNIYKPIINSGLAFGPKHWIATLNRKC